MNKPTIDINLIYYNSPEYDNSEILNKLLYRLYEKTDYLKYSDLLNFHIVDSGSPEIQLNKSLEVVKKWSSIKHIEYFLCNTEEIRNYVKENLPGMVCRPFSHCVNIAINHSTADIFQCCVVGALFSKDHFKNTLAQHIANDKIVLQPRRLDLNCQDYHEKYYDMDFDELINKFESNIVSGGGWPMFSVRREHLLAIGGYDTEYTVISPNDMCLGSRLCGVLDNGMPSEALYPGMPPFNNYGLEFVQPNIANFVSLVCNTFPNHIPTNDEKRQKSYNYGIEYYLKNWGKIVRNENPKFKVDYKIIN